MIPKQAIEKAIEGGWKQKLMRPLDFAVLFTDPYSKKSKDHADSRLAQIALDPTFWQCLAKALGWKDYDDDGENFCLKTYLLSNDEIMIKLPQWRFNADCFFDLILTNGDTAAFWSDLLAEPVV